MVWSPVDPQTLIAHLQAFLFADIGDGTIAMVRYFDPRTRGAVFKVWGEQISSMFMGPIERWMYQGRHEHWQHIENDSLTGARICRSFRIELEQPDVDALCVHRGALEVNKLAERFFHRHDLDHRHLLAINYGLGQPELRFCKALVQSCQHVTAGGNLPGRCRMKRVGGACEHVCCELKLGNERSPRCSLPFTQLIQHSGPRKVMQIEKPKKRPSRKSAGDCSRLHGTFAQAAMDTLAKSSESVALGMILRMLIVVSVRKGG